MSEARPPHRRAQRPPALDKKVAFLRDPASYPGPRASVDAVETHMSWVFLAGQDVYKLKKPVRYELLDFRSLQARQRFCAEELRLNRRLAPSVYLGLVPLTLQRDGRLCMGGTGQTVDWLVHMQRLPAADMLDYALLHGTMRPGDLQRVAARLATFYRTLPPEPVSAAEWLARLRRQTGAHRRALSAPVSCLPAGHVRALAADQLAVLGQLAPLIAARVAAGRIVEGHGDLRPEHVCLAEPVVIIDCLEFSRSLRLADSADELGFLALECERLGNAAAGEELLGSYAAISGDAPPRTLLHFYQSRRAMARAVLAARHLLDERFRHSPQWLRRAGHYVQLAERHIRLAQG